MFDQTFDEEMARFELDSAWWSLSSIDMRLFALERRTRNLERNWPGEGKLQQHELRMERVRLRGELELLKIDLKDLERRTAEWLETQAESAF